MFTQADCGKRKVIYKSATGEKAKISGALHIESERILKDEEKNIYEIDVPVGTKSRQLFVNGVRATRARSKETLQNCTTDASGHTTTDTFLADFEKIKDLEMVYSSKWLHMRCGVQDISVSDGVATITMDDVWEKRYDPSESSRPKTPQYYENAYELLDEEGEWYLDEDIHKLYYIPRAYEDIHTADIVMPTLERLIEMQGTYEKHISNITFENIEFCYTTWMRPGSEKGYMVRQNNTLEIEGYEGEGSLYAQHVDGALELNSVTNIDFKNCNFSKLGTTALKMIGGVSDCDIVGNEFYDNSAGAIVLGQCGYKIDYGYIVRPDKQAYPEKYYVQHNTITNNYIHNGSVDYKSASAISLGFVRDTLVSHNEIFDMPYSGIHIGWGWSGCTGSVLKSLRVENNYIHDILNQEIYDGGAIYTVGGTSIARGIKDNEGNVIPYDESIFEDERINIISGNYMVDIKNRNAPMYNDAGSSGYFWKDNVVDLTSTPYWYGNNDGTYQSGWFNGGGTVADNALKAVNTYTTTGHTLDGVFIETDGFYVYEDAAWPKEALDIIKNSGINQENLDKFGIAVQELSIEEAYNISVNDTQNLMITAKTRKNQACSMENCTIYWYSSNPDIVSVSEDGTLTAKKSGNVKVTAYVILEGGLLEILETNVECI